MNDPALLPDVLSQIAAETGAAAVRLQLARRPTGEVLLGSTHGDVSATAAGDTLAHVEARSGLALSIEAARTATDTPFSAAAINVFGQLRPYMKRALVLAARLRLGARPTAHAASVIMASGRPLATLDPDGAVVIVNPAALRHGLSAEAIVEAIGGSKALGSMCRAAVRNGAWTIRVDHGGARLFWRLQAHPPPVNALILDLDVPHDDKGVRLDLFSQTHALTKAERAVLELAVSGYSAEDIATDRQSSRETVRVQLRSIREKTGCTSLLAMTAAVTGFHVD